MFVLTRKLNESFIIGEDIEITVLDTSKDKARIGINAPSDVKITRKEVYVTKEQNKQATITPTADIMKKLLKGLEGND